MIPVSRVLSGPTAQRLFRGVGWNLIATVAMQGSTFVVNVAAANILGRQVYGEYAIVQTTLLLLSSLAQLASGYTATKYAAEFRHSDPDRAGRILGLCSLVSAAAGATALILLLSASGWLAGTALRAPQLTGALMVCSVAVLFSVLNGYQLGALAGLEHYRGMAAAGVTSGLIYIIVCISAAWRFGFNGLLIGLVISYGAQWTLLNLTLTREARRQGIRVTIRGMGAERSVLWRFALPAAVAGMSTLPALWIAQAVLTRQEGGISSIAVYSAANSFRIMVLFVPAVVNRVVMSILNNKKGAGAVPSYLRLFHTNLLITSSFALASALVIALAGELLLTLFGEDFTDGVSVLRLMMIAAVAEVIFAGLVQLVQTAERIWRFYLTVSLPRDLLLVILAIQLAPSRGAVGLAMAYALSATAALVPVALLVWTIRKHLRRTAEPTLSALEPGIFPLSAP